MVNWKFQPPGLKRLQVFAENFKSDFDCLQPQRRTYAITFDALKYDQGSSQIYALTEPEPTHVENSQVAPTNSIDEPVAVDSPQPNIIHAQEPENPPSVTSGSSISDHVTLIPSNDAVELCVATTPGAATVAVLYPSPPVTEEGGPEASETETSSKSGETDDGEDWEDGETDDDYPRHSRTIQFHNCKTVYMNAFNARGVKFKNSGNNAPHVTYNDAPSSKSSESLCHDDLCQSSRYPIAPPIFTPCNLPPMIPPLHFQKSEENLLYPLVQSAPPDTTPPVGIPGPDNSDLKGKLLVTTEITSLMLGNGDAILGYHSPKIPGSKILPGSPDSEFSPATTNTSGHMALHSDFLLSTFSGAAPANNNTADILSSQSNSHSRHYPLIESQLAAHSMRDSPDTNSILLEHQLQSVLDTVLSIQKQVQTSGTSSSAEILTPRAQGILRAVNALVSTETPVSSPRASTSSTWRGRHCHGCQSPY